MSLMYRHAQDEPLMAKTRPTSDVVDDDEDPYTGPLQIPLPKAKRQT
jgi:hypothetical protein